MVQSLVVTLSEQHYFSQLSITLALLLPSVCLFMNNLAPQKSGWTSAQLLDVKHCPDKTHRGMYQKLQMA